MGKVKNLVIPTLNVNDDKVTINIVGDNGSYVVGIKI